MTTDRAAAIALVSGSAAGLLTMILHPSGHDVIAAASAGGTNLLNAGVHAMAIGAQPLVLAGALALSLRLRAARELAITGYVFFAVASIAVLIAAVASGFVAPAAVEGLGEADPRERLAMLDALRYTAHLNQAFAKVHVALSAAAIGLWSLAILRGGELRRPIGVYGLVLAPLLLTGIASGALRLDIHGFGIVVLTEGAWFAWSALALWRTEA